MPKCKNCQAYYTGNEPSPRGIGYHAKAEALHVERLGLDRNVWHVAEFGPRKIHRWQVGTSVPSKYVHVGQIVQLPAHDPGMGLLYPNTNVYKETSWSCYTFEVVDKMHVRIVENDLGIPISPMLLEDFKDLYKQVYGLHDLPKEGGAPGSNVQGAVPDPDPVSRRPGTRAPRV